jgi:DNA-binding MarR family transcriptional regulator
MKTFHSETALAPMVIETSALVMRRVRSEARRAGTGGLSFTEMRALGCLHHTPGLSLSEVSEFLGIGAPTTSKAVDDMVREGLVRRETAAEDRRRVTLHVTKEGRKALEVAATPARRHIAELLATLAPADLETVERAMEIMLPLLNPARVDENGDE